LPLNVSAKTFTLYSRVPNDVLNAKLYIYSTIFTTNCTTFISIKIYAFPSVDSTILVSCLETGSQDSIQTGFGFGNGFRNPINP